MKTKTFFLPAILVFMLFFGTSCFSDWNVISGTGSIVTQSRSGKNFTAIELQTSADVEIVKGDTFNISVSDYENLVSHLAVEVVDNCLIVKRESNKLNLWNSKAKVRVTLPDPLYSLKISGSGDIEMQDSFNDLHCLFVSGSGNIELKGNCQLKKLEVQISGSGNIKATGSGTAQEIVAKIAGSGNMQFPQIKTKSVNCTISGSGNTSVYVEDKLEASLFGSGNIVYSGQPIVKSNLSGSGHIYKK